MPRGQKNTTDRSGWTQDPDGVRRNILEVASTEFTQKGLSGARVDDIAAKTATSKRMIYYYFGGKQQLYLAVLEKAYAKMRSAELALSLDTMPAHEAMERLVGLTFDHHRNNLDFVRLVMVENIHHGQHLKQLPELARLNMSAISTLGAIYDRGIAEGAFRAGLDPMQVHLTISALSFYNVSNRHSIATGFNHDMADPANVTVRRQVVIETVMRYLSP